jgi:Mg-chelatase subunit ChlD
MVQTIIRKTPKNVAISDIVFCIDISDSMTPCIEGVKNNVNNLIETIEKDPEISIDWQLGLLAHFSDHETIDFWIKDFTSDVEAFKRSVSSLETGSSEANLPALDWSLDFPWRENAHKFIIMFTDESVDGGWNPDKSRSKIEELKKKIRKIGASIYVVSFNLPEYKDYLEIASTDKCDFIEIDSYNGFEGAEFEKLLEKLGKKISTGSRGIVKNQGVVKKDIYEVSSIVNIKRL